MPEQWFGLPAVFSITLRARDIALPSEQEAPHLKTPDKLVAVLWQQQWCRGALCSCWSHPTHGNCCVVTQEPEVLVSADLGGCIFSLARRDAISKAPSPHTYTFPCRQCILESVRVQQQICGGSEPHRTGRSGPGCLCSREGRCRFVPLRWGLSREPGPCCAAEPWPLVLAVRLSQHPSLCLIKSKQGI